VKLLASVLFPPCQVIVLHYILGHGSIVFSIARCAGMSSSFYGIAYIFLGLTSTKINVIKIVSVELLGLRYFS